MPVVRQPDCAYRHHEERVEEDELRDHWHPLEEIQPIDDADALDQPEDTAQQCERRSNERDPVQATIPKVHLVDHVEIKPSIIPFHTTSAPLDSGRFGGRSQTQASTKREMCAIQRETTDPCAPPLAQESLAHRRAVERRMRRSHARSSSWGWSPSCGLQPERHVAAIGAEARLATNQRPDTRPLTLGRRPAIAPTSVVQSRAAWTNPRPGASRRQGRRKADTISDTSRPHVHQPGSRGSRDPKEGRCPCLSSPAGCWCSG